VVRGASALLAAAGGALAYLLIAPALPDLGDGDAALLVAGGLGLAVLGGLALSVVPLRSSPALVVALGGGAALVAGVLSARGTGAAGDVPKALLAACVGVALGRFLATPLVLVAVPIFVGAIDVWSVGSGPTSELLARESGAVDFLSLVVGAWGGGEVGRLGLSDIVFLALYATFAWELGLRRVVTAVALVGALVVALVLQVVTDRAVPVLPLLGAALLLPNADRVVRLLAPASQG
jgi:hypothetical protein